MRHDDRGTDLVEQHRAALTPYHVRGFGSTREAAVNRQWRQRTSGPARGPQRGSRAPGSARRCRSAGRRIAPTLTRHQLIEFRCSHFTGSGPLVVQLPIRPRGRPRRIRRREQSRDGLEHRGLGRERAVEIRMERRPAVTRPIDDVDAEASLQQAGKPARATVRSAHPVGALAAAAVYQHHRVRMARLRGDPVLDVHLLAVDHRAARQVRLLDPDPEVAPFGEIECPVGGVAVLHADLVCGVRTGCAQQHRGCTTEDGRPAKEFAPRLQDTPPSTTRSRWAAMGAAV